MAIRANLSFFFSFFNLFPLGKVSKSKWQYELIQEDLAMNIQRLLAYNLVKLEILLIFEQIGIDFSFVLKSSHINEKNTLYMMMFIVMYMSDRWCNINIEADIELSGEILQMGASHLLRKIQISSRGIFGQLQKGIWTITKKGSPNDDIIDGSFHLVRKILIP